MTLFEEWVPAAAPLLIFCVALFVVPRRFLWLTYLSAIAIMAIVEYAAADKWDRTFAARTVTLVYVILFAVVWAGAELWRPSGNDWPIRRTAALLVWAAAIPAGQYLGLVIGCFQGRCP